MILLMICVTFLCLKILSLKILVIQLILTAKKSIIKNTSVEFELSTNG